MMTAVPGDPSVPPGGFRDDARRVCVTRVEDAGV